MTTFRFCKKSKDTLRLDYLQKITESLSLQHIFNPSFYRNNQLTVMSFRAIRYNDNKINSFISIEDGDKHIIKNISSEYCDILNASQLIDPKVFTLEDDVYITFNTGWDKRGNDIFIMKVHPAMEQPKKIIYDKRNEQERNWAFFSEQGTIYALYWINPLKILRLKEATDDTWLFEDSYLMNKEVSNISSNLTLGTQLSKKDGRYYCMAHKKFVLLTKKIYLGRLCVFDFKNKSVRLGTHWIIHSFKSMFGSRKKTNKNLLSCTYFSGIQAEGDHVYLGYGINDVTSGFSKHTIDEL